MARRRNAKNQFDRSLRERLAAAADGAEALPEPELTVVPDPPPIEQERPAARQRPASRQSRLRPHALRQANRMRRTWISLLGIPFLIVFVLVDLLRDLGDLIQRSRRVEQERSPSFRRPESMPAPEARTMDEIVAVVEGFPFEPPPLPTNVIFFRDHGADTISALLSSNPQMSSLPHRYPSAFRERLLRGYDDQRLAGMQALHEHSGPALVICHGMLMNKHFDVIIQLARRAYEQWGFHVVTMDLRSWGQSAWTTDAPSSGGYHEGRDLVEVCRDLHEHPLITSVGVVGFSLGGSTVLNAAHVSSLSQDRPIDGGAVTISAPTNIGPVLEHISTKPHWRHPYFALWHVFRAAIKSSVRREKLGSHTRTWLDLLRTVSVPYYGMSMDELCEQSSAVNFAHEIDQPVLDLHATDDFLVPVSNAYDLQDATVDNPWVHVMVRDAGSHCAFAAADPAWFHSTLRRWLEYWATPGVFEPDVDPDELLG